MLIKTYYVLYWATLGILKLPPTKFFWCFDLLNQFLEANLSFGLSDRRGVSRHSWRARLSGYFGVTCSGRLSGGREWREILWAQDIVPFVSHHPVLGCIQFIAPTAWTQRYVVLLNRDAYDRNKVHNLCGVWAEICARPPNCSKYVWLSRIMLSCHFMLVRCCHSFLYGCKQACILPCFAILKCRWLQLSLLPLSPTA